MIKQKMSLIAAFLIILALLAMFFRFGDKPTVVSNGFKYI
jgi:hypothetical protein